jgi:hypothetical protein
VPPHPVARLFFPLIFGFLASKTGWLYAAMFQRDQPMSVFQKTISKYLGWFTVGMGYIVLWQYELAEAFHFDSAWRWLLGIWTGLIVWQTLRSLRLSDPKEREPDTPDFRKP